MTAVKKINFKIVLVCSILILGVAFPVFSQSPIPLDKLSSTMDEFSQNMANGLPFNAGMGLNWSYAGIGKFPHFGAGLSGGFTTINADSLSEMMKMFVPGMPAEFSKLGGFPIPGLMIEGRLGGFGIPFDLGVKVGYLPTKPKEFDSMDYFLLGFDVRFALIQDKGVLPCLSIGVGYNRMEGGLGKSIGDPIKIDYPLPGDTTGTVTMSPPELGINWSVNTLDFKAQLSKSFGLMTPYFGLGACYGKAKAGYSLKTKITDDTNSDIEAAKDILNEFGGIVSKNGSFSTEKENNGWNYRAFAGFSINLWVLKIDLTGLFGINKKDDISDLMAYNWGITLGTRVQF